MRNLINKKILTLTGVVALLVWSQSAFADAPPPIADSTETANEVVPGDAEAATEEAAAEESRQFTSDGTRVVVANGEISMVPPLGWEVFTGHPSLTLLMRVPREKRMKYQRTIQVASFSGVKFIDEISIKEFEELIVRKFSQTSASVEDYRIRNSMAISMDDGREGLLFYSEFQIDGVPLMQAHIMVTTAERHYMMTFTDLAEHFEGEQAASYLNVAWATMTSVQLSGPTPARYQTMRNAGAALGGVAALVLCLMGINRYRAKSRYKQYEAGATVAMDDDELSKSGFTTMAKEAFITTNNTNNGMDDDFVSQPPISEYSSDDDQDADERAG